MIRRYPTPGDYDPPKPHKAGLPSDKYTDKGYNAGWDERKLAMREEKDFDPATAVCLPCDAVTRLGNPALPFQDALCVPCGDAWLEAHS
ncbi:hypothetical protein LCGC14_2171770 [marine sediment metagenome]|uniref:Uncharacterized protein n=1 Tax=marine sediment metagenome TaxID=412755 RepID=A0A0F9GKW2_9ZZZZ